MLVELTVNNLAIINQATLKWKPGFTVISGETGSGKSILMSALKILLGERAKSDAVGKWNDRTKVEAIFEIPENKVLINLLKEFEIDFEELERFWPRSIA